LKKRGRGDIRRRDRKKKRGRREKKPLKKGERTQGKVNSKNQKRRIEERKLKRGGEQGKEAMTPCIGQGNVPMNGKREDFRAEWRVYPGESNSPK